MSKTNLDQIPVVIRIVYLRDKLKLLVQLFKDIKAFNNCKALRYLVNVRFHIVCTANNFLED